MTRSIWSLVIGSLRIQGAASVRMRLRGVAGNVSGWSSTDHGSYVGQVPGSLLAEGFGPGAVAMAVLGFAIKANVAFGGHELFKPSQVGAKFVVAHQAEFAVFEVPAQAEGQLLL